ncbi:MAG: MarR family transcriptional regulator [Rhodospirillales bacterium]|nr:MarR family transcriptional regulator [Rhodospirillales bacterium]
MTSLLILICAIALAGAGGGWANYLLLTASRDGREQYPEAMRFVIAGAITAFVVPLFLSLAQSALVKAVFDGWEKGTAFPDALVLIGFCVVAGFASKAFLDSVSTRILQMQRDMQRLDGKADAASKEAKAAASQALEAIELSEESAEQLHPPAVKARLSGGLEALATSAEDERLAATLTTDELAVLRALSRLPQRTQTGIARDAGIARSQIAEIVEKLVAEGLAHFGASASGSLRVSLSEKGAGALAAAVRHS